MSKVENLIAKARRLHLAATPGPWEYGPPPTQRYAYTQTSISGAGCEVARLPLPPNDGDGAFIVGARALLPAMADRLEEIVKDRNASEEHRRRVERELAEADTTNVRLQQRIETLEAEKANVARSAADGILAEREANAVTKARLDAVTEAARKAYRAFFADLHTSDDSACYAMANLRDAIG